MSVEKVTIDWISHHSDDEIDQVENQLEAGLDEGPLLVVSDALAKPGRSGECYLFRDVSCYLGHLAMYAGELDDERWVGLVRGTFSDNAPALSALWQLKTLLARPSRSRPKRPKGSKPRLGVKSFDYATLQESFEPIEELEIQAVGYAAEDFLRVFPKVGALMRVGDEEGS